MRVTSTWRPRNRETYWYIGSDGKPWPAVWFDDSSINRARMELGNVLRTRQDAEQRIASIRARVRLRESADRLNLGWRPNWSDTSEPKWTIVYDHQQKQFLPAWGECEDLDCVYFRTDELARQAITELGEDLHKVLDYRRSKRREVVKGRLEEIRNPRFSLLMRITQNLRKERNV